MFDDAEKSYSSTVDSIEQFKEIKTYLPLSKGAAMHGTEVTDPAYQRIKEFFERMQAHSGFIYEQLQATAESATANTAQKIQWTKEWKPEPSEIILFI